MPIGYNQDVELLIAARTAGGDDVDALGRQINGLEADLRDFDKVGKSVSVLEGAQESVEFFKQSLSLAQGRVKQLQATLSEAFNVGMDAPGIKALEKQLGAAQRAATAAANDLKRAQNNVDRLDAAGAKAGVTVANLADKKAELGREAARTSEKLGELNRRLDAATFAQEKAASQASRLNDAFGRLGIRSAAQIEGEINAINRDLVMLAQRADLTGAEFDKAFAAGQKKIAGLRAELNGVPDEMGNVARRTDNLIGVVGRLALAYGGLELARKFIEANVALEALDRGLTQITGSSAAAQKEIEWLREASNRLGVEAQSAGKAYMSLAASAKGTSLEGEGTRRIFEAVAGSMAKLGKSSADTEGALQAIAQMMGKGTVSMEEMRQQLAERLPGAMQAAADGAGVTVAELTQMIASGQVLAEDLLPKLAGGLEAMYGTAGQVDGAVPAWNRLKNAVAETFQFIGNSGVMTAIVAILGQMAIAVRGLTGAFELLGKIVGISLGAIVNFDWKHPIDSMRNWKQSVTDAADEIQRRMDKVKGASSEAAQAQDRLAAEAARSGNSASASVPGWLAVINAYGKVAITAKESTEQAVKAAAAREEEGKASVSLANLLGNENDKRMASIQASQSSAAALQTLANARQQEASVALAQAQAMQVVADAEGRVSEAKRKAIQEANDKATALQSEADKAAATALAAQQRAAALQTETEAMKDNSGRINELRDASEKASASLELMRAAREAGTATAKQVSDAEISAAQAAALYRDALKDQTEKIQDNARVKQGQIAVDQAAVRLAIEQQRTIFEVARARGDEYSATQALLEIKRLEIKLAELTAQAKAAEAKASLMAVEAKYKELEASDQLTAHKRAELEAQRLAAQAKQVEAQIAGETAKRMRELTDATLLSGNAARGTIGHFGGMSGAIDQVASSARDAVSALSDLDRYERNKYSKPVNDGGFSNGGHQASRQVDLTNYLYQSGASMAEVKAAQKYIGEFYERNKATMLTGNLGNSTRYTELNKQAIADATEKALAAARQELATGKAVDIGASVKDLMERNLANVDWKKQLTPNSGIQASINAVQRAGREASAGFEASKTVRIEIGSGRDKSTVFASSDEEADRFVRHMESLAGRAA